MSRTDTSRNAPGEIDAYLDILPTDVHSALERERNIIREAAPACTERVSYKIPIFRQGIDIVGMSAQKNHCALHCMSPPLMKSMAEELKDYNVSGATIHFTSENPLPREIIEKIVRERIRESEVIP